MVRYIVIGDYISHSLRLFKPDVVHHFDLQSTEQFNIEELKRLCTKYPAAIVIFMAGNAIMQIEIYRQAIFNTLPVTNFSKYILQQVGSWTAWIRDLDLKNRIIICGAILPTVTDEYHERSLLNFMNISCHSVYSSRVKLFLKMYPKVNAIEWRKSLIKDWNFALEMACRREVTSTCPTAGVRGRASSSICYIDINEDIIVDGAIAPEYRHINPTNNTLLWESLVDVWKARLDLNECDVITPRDMTYIDNKRREVIKKYGKQFL